MPGNNPSLVKESLWHTPQDCTLIRTCLAPGSGISLSTISRGPLALVTINAKLSPNCKYSTDFVYMTFLPALKLTLYYFVCTILEHVP